MPAEIDLHLGRRLRRRRRLLGLTQQQLGDRVGIRFQQIQKYECGANRISAARAWACRPSPWASTLAIWPSSSASWCCTAVERSPSISNAPQLVRSPGIAFAASHLPLA